MCLLFNPNDFGFRGTCTSNSRLRRQRGKQGDRGNAVNTTLPPLGVSWEAEEPLQSDTENGSVRVDRADQVLPSKPVQSR